MPQKMTAEKTECMGCGTMVGEGYTEKQFHQVGDYRICGWCYDQLKKRGHLWVQPYNSRVWLYPDGRVKVKKPALGGDKSISTVSTGEGRMP